MRRVQLVLAALAIVVASFAAISGPAMADDWNNHRWDDNWNNHRSDDNWWWNNHIQECPFWGDTSGVVNQWDCFD